MTLTPESALRKDRNSGMAHLEHRHFATIATIIREGGARVPDRQFMAEIFAARLPETNPKFDRKRFMAAAVGQ